MKCEDVLKLLPALALGDLDAEERRAVEDHVAACGACRTESDRAGRTAALLRGVTPVETAEARRDRTVEAMSREHADRVQGILLAPKRPRRWMAGAAAAGLLVAFGAAGLFVWNRTRETCTLQVTEVRGSAQVLRKGTWQPVLPGTRLDRGDRLLSGPETVVSAEIVFRGDTVGTLHLNQNTAIAIGPDRTIDLERGDVSGSVTSGPLHFRSVGNDTLTVRTGRFEAGLRDWVTMVAGVSMKKPERPANPDAALSFEDQPFAVVARALEARLRLPIRLAGEDVARRKVWFYGASDRDLLRDFEKAMIDQGIFLRREGGGFVANLALIAEKRDISRRFYARVNEGDATIGSTGGFLKLSAGDEGFIQKGGTPSLRRFTSADAPWLKPDFYHGKGRERLAIPGTLSFRVVRQDGRPTVECEVEGDEILAMIDNEPAVIRVGSPVERGEGEFEVPVRIRFERRP